MLSLLNNSAKEKFNYIATWSKPFSALLFQFVILSGLILTNSCQSKSDEANANFLKQYGNNVNEINKKRDEANQIQANIDCQSSPNGCEKDKNKWKDSATIFGIENSNKIQNASIDTSKIVMPKPPEEFSPNVQTLLERQGAQLPENMFQISYNLYNFPDSYGKSRVSFDDINIPKSDAFGVKTELGEKNYQLIGNKTLQKDVDFTKQVNTQEDREISIELIRQEKQRRRKGNEKVNVKNSELTEANTKIDPQKMTKVEVGAIFEKTSNTVAPEKLIDNLVGTFTDKVNQTISDNKTGN